MPYRKVVFVFLSSLVRLRVRTIRDLMFLGPDNRFDRIKWSATISSMMFSGEGGLTNAIGSILDYLTWSSERAGMLT